MLTVASWFPAVDSPYRGRFVADAVAALEATGRAAPLVVSFDSSRASGDDELRGRQRDALRARRHEATTNGRRLFSRRGWGGPAGVPVARPPVAVGHPGAADDDDAADALAEIVGRAVGASATDLARVPVVHAHRGLPDGHAAAAIARRHGWPLVITEHYSRIDQHFVDTASGRRYRAAMAAAARVIVMSQTQAARLLAFVPEVEPRLAVVPNVVAVQEFAVALESDVPRVPGELLFVGNRKADKGIALLLEAFARARSERVDLTLRLVGTSDTAADEEGWRALARRLGVADCVRFDPPADRAGVVAAMARADVFVHPAPLETFGVVAAEALAAGLPVVATDSGGVTEILDGGNPALGSVVPSGDSAAFATAILAVLGRRASFDAASLHRSAAERYAPQVVAERLLAVYDEVRDGARATSVLDPALPGLVSAERASRALLVAFGRRHAAQVLATLDDEVRSRLTVLTAAGDSPLAAHLDVREVDLDEPFRAALREPGAERWRRIPDVLLRTDRFGRKRREIARRRLTLGLPSAAAAVRRAAAADPAAELVPLDAFDHLALREAGVTRGPGGLRWLADGWWRGD